MSDGDLALSILRKMMDRELDGCYINVGRDSMCVDGWVEKMSPEEVALADRLYEEARAADEARYLAR